MTKKWSENCTAKLKSYQIEEKVLDFFANDEFSDNKEYSVLVRDFFEYFYQATYDENLKSHLSTALNRARKACEFEENGNLEKATDEWKKIFGDDFPAAAEKAAPVSTEAKPSLEDYSHCEALRWPYAGEGKVNIDAFTYDYGKTKKFGGLNSDGRNLPAGLSLKYIARTSINGDPEYYWQVVNTGNHAKSANDLRGTIFQGRQIHWEHTKYKGKHWIECFLVKNGYCIARSGKFFVNIK